MKKIFLLIISIILFSIVHAQNLDVERINKDWSKLVDYVTLKYNQAGLEYGIKDEGTRNVYEERIKSVLDTQKINQCMPIDTFLTLVQSVFPDYHLNIDLSPAKTQLIEQLLGGNITAPDSGLQKVIDDTQKQLRTEILSEYKIQPSSVEEEESDSSNCLPIWVYIFMAVLLAAAIALAIWTFLLNRKMAGIRHSQKRQDDSASFSRNSDAEHFQAQINILQDRMADLEKKAALWAEKGLDFEKELGSLRNLSSQLSKDQPEVEEKSNTIYVKNFKKGVLKKCSKEEAQFCLIETQQELLAFEFCGNIEYAMANRDATFDGVCNLHGNPNKAIKIVNENRGTVKSVASDRWQVVEMATVKFE